MKGDVGILYEAPLRSPAVLEKEGDSDARRAGDFLMGRIVWGFETRKIISQATEISLAS
jgi:hypothetical protein